MGYIIKNTSGLVNTRLTDTGRLKLSQGSFNIAYFQIGDSEVSYNTLPTSTYNQFNSFVLEPSFNAQNSTGVPESNKENVKYPYYVDGTTGNTYGIPFMDSIVSPVYNRAAPRGFFSGITSADPISWSAFTNNLYAINSNYLVQMNTLSGTNVITLIYSGCNVSPIRTVNVGDIVTIYYDGSGATDCVCYNVPTPTPTPTTTVTPTTSPPFGVTSTPTPSPTDICASPTPTPTPSATFCPTPTPSSQCPPVPEPDCVVSIKSCYPILTYRVTKVCDNIITLDRETPDYSDLLPIYFARVIVYPPTLTTIYDSITPSNHWSDSVINFESVCYTDQFDVKIWNMNIPWSENPAGLNSANQKDYTQFGSINYLGSKEYFGYASSSGQTTTIPNYYFNSFSDTIIVTPEEQKSIAIIHYTNQTVDLFYGEKFALEPFDNTVDDTTGQARNFKVHIPWLMWHKNTDCCNGQTFYVDPPGFDGLNLFENGLNYIKSTKNPDMNEPGLRYYNLYDDNVNLNSLPNRVGKVFPDSKIIIFDDEEIVAAMSYKSNRNWTLPAPRIALITPNTCGDVLSSTGVLTGNTEYLYVTYRLTNTSAYTNSLHCNYYMKIQGPNTNCNPSTPQNVSVRFGNEFRCMTTPTSGCSANLYEGYQAEKFEIICQKVVGDVRPESSEWKILDYTNSISAYTQNGYLTVSALTGNTFVITQDNYDAAPFYDLNDYITMSSANTTNTQLNFGDEYYFYGNVETDIQATIYEMRYKINLSQVEFQTTSNPSYINGQNKYVTEVGLYDADKNLLIISKMQSPVLRQGIQQFLIKFDI
jgi:hypothetical protein